MSRQRRDLLQESVHAAKSMADSAVSVMPKALTKAQSAVNAAATRAVGQAENATSALTNLTEQMADRIALNCSIGTKKVCVNYRSGKECFTLPFNTSLLIPKPLTEGSNPVTSGIQDAVGLAVDRILGQREIVIRAIKAPLAQSKGIAGATELGDPRVVLILDISALRQLAVTSLH